MINPTPKLTIQITHPCEDTERVMKALGTIDCLKPTATNLSEAFLQVGKLDFFWEKMIVLLIFLNLKPFARCGYFTKYWK